MTTPHPDAEHDTATSRNSQSRTRFYVGALLRGLAAGAVRAVLDWLLHA